jgi:hypothetical protein
MTHQMINNHDNETYAMAELDLAIAAYEANPEAVRPMEEVFADLRERILSNK